MTVNNQLPTTKNERVEEVFDIFIKHDRQSVGTLFHWTKGPVNSTINTSRFRRGLPIETETTGTLFQRTTGPLFHWFH